MSASYPTRRAFLQSVAVAAIARGYVAGCGSSSSGGAGPLTDGGLDGGSGDLPWSVWRAMREAIRTSPDSLGDKAAALVAAKDANAIFTFVRDDIATLPTQSFDTEKATRWGPTATLRGGAGSMRDRADLLASLLKQAGFQASVVSGVPDSQLTGINGPTTVYVRDVAPAFSPAAPPSSLGSTWLGALTGSDTGAPAPKPLDANGAQAKAIFDTIDALLPSSASANAGPFSVFNVPIVALQQNGQTVYLNPHLPTAAFGEAHATQITAAPAAMPLPTIQATLLVALPSAPDTQVPLVSATYTIDQLIGRQLVVQTQPSQSLDALILSPLSAITSFISTMSVQGADLTAAQRSALVTTGAWVTQTGDILTTASDGTVTVNGTSIGKGTGTSPSSVASVQVTQVNASAFPQIELTVSALDGNGKGVIGLGASAFQVSEDGGPVSFLLRDNGIAPPRILFLIDRTGSQPTIPTAWATSVAQAIYAAAPNATVQVVPFDTATASATGYGISDAAALATALTNTNSDGSVLTQMWEGILAGESANPTLIVLMNDGNADDMNYQAQAMTRLAGGTPILSVCCYAGTTPISLATMQQIGSASGGVAVDAGALTDATTVTTPLSKMLQGRAAGPYRLSYVAPTQGPSMRTVTVTANTKSGTGTYTVPAMPVAGGAVIGLYLQITYTDALNNTESYTRILGGHVPGTDITAPGALAASADDARAAMLGSALISFEGGAPSVSTWMADTLTWRLATETAYKSFAASDVKGGFSNLGGLPASFPRETFALHPALLPPSTPGVLVSEQSLRAVMFCVRAKDPPFHADILPFTRFVTSSASSTLDFFRTSLLASLRLAVAEADAFKTSTVSLLQGKQLTMLMPGGVTASQIPSQVPAAQVPAFVYTLNQYQSWYRFIASDGSSLAFWAVHQSTGSALGVLPDGSGGGSDPCGAYQRLATFLDLFSLLSGVLGVPMLSLWATLGKLVALAGVETLLAFDGANIMVSPGSQVITLECSFASGLVGSLTIPGSGNGLGSIAINFFQSAAVDSAGQKAGCPPSPCG